LGLLAKVDALGTSGMASDRSCCAAATTLDALLTAVYLVFPIALSCFNFLYAAAALREMTFTQLAWSLNKYGSTIHYVSFLLVFVSTHETKYRDRYAVSVKP
jgi:hypothetical protein